MNGRWIPTWGRSANVHSLNLYSGSAYRFNNHASSKERTIILNVHPGWKGIVAVGSLSLEGRFPTGTNTS